MSLFIIGIVCSGNTCRSPIAAAWVHQMLGKEHTAADVYVWTAGLNAKGGSHVSDETWKIAQKMNFREDVMSYLEDHRSRNLKKEERETHLLVWITDPQNVNVIDRGFSSTRVERIREKVEKLGALLIVIPQADDAYMAKIAGRPEQEVLELYRIQAAALGQWVSALPHFIPIGKKQSRGES